MVYKIAIVQTNAASRQSHGTFVVLQATKNQKTQK